MTNHAYLRVSTDAQDVENQKHGLLEYSNQMGISPIQFVEDTASGKVKWRDRKLGALIDSAQSGDVIIFAEISRIARSTLQVLEVLEHCLERGIFVHVAKQKMVFDDSINSKVMATMLGLAAEIDRIFISMRTKEALAKRKKDGMTLGRPKGPAASVKLDEHREEILMYLDKGISKRDIAKLVDCAPSTLYDWLKREGIKT